MKYRVFVSSTTADLGDYRVAVIDALNKMHNDVDMVVMEDWVAHDATSMEVCRRKIQGGPDGEPGCDIFVGLIGHYFGSAPDAQPDRSYTMLEYDWAVQVGVATLMHRATDDVPVKPSLIRADGTRKQELQVAFRDSLSGQHLGQMSSWERPYKLANDVAQSVRNQIDRMRARDQTTFTLDRFKVSLLDRLEDIDRSIPLLAPDERQRQLDQREEIAKKIRALEQSYEQQLKKIEQLKRELETLRDNSPAALRAALGALEARDLDKADALFAQVIEDQHELLEQLSSAEYGRGEVASIQSRFHDARWHFIRAASMSANFERLSKAAIFLALHGEKAEAVNALEMQVDVARAEFGDTHEKVSVAMGNVAQFAMSNEEYEKAEQFYRTALELGDAHGRRETHVYAFHQLGYAMLLRRLERLSEAGDRLVLAERGYTHFSGTERIAFVGEVIRVASQLKDVGQDAAAVALFELVDDERMAELPDHSTDPGRREDMLSAYRHVRERLQDPGTA